MKIKVMLLSMALTVLSAPAFAERFVSVNGTRLNLGQIALLERWNCTAIPNGQYWLNLHTGAWGYVGSPFTRGYFGEYCRPAQRQQSLSARGMLFSPQDFRNRW